MCVGTLTLVGLLAGCGDRHPGGFHPSGQAPAAGSGASSAGGVSPAGTASADDPAARTPESALAAYRNYQHVYEQVAETQNTRALGAVATDPLLSVITKDVAKAKRQGVFWSFHNVLNPRVQGSSADNSTIVILDCVRTLGSYRYSAKTGKRLGSWNEGSHLYQAIMRFTDGVYKISDATQGRKC
jgi:hypothetical protein